MFSMWENVSGAIMDAPHPWQHGPLRKRKTVAMLVGRVILNAPLRINDNPPYPNPS